MLNSDLEVDPGNYRESIHNEAQHSPVAGNKINKKPCRVTGVFK